MPASISPLTRAFTAVSIQVKNSGNYQRSNASLIAEAIVGLLTLGIGAIVIEFLHQRHRDAKREDFIKSEIVPQLITAIACLRNRENSICLEIDGEQVHLVEVGNNIEVTCGDAKYQIIDKKLRAIRDEIFRYNGRHGMGEYVLRNCIQYKINKGLEKMNSTKHSHADQIKIDRDRSKNVMAQNEDGSLTQLVSMNPADQSALRRNLYELLIDQNYRALVGIPLAHAYLDCMSTDDGPSLLEGFNNFHQTIFIVPPSFEKNRELFVTVRYDPAAQGASENKKFVEITVKLTFAVDFFNALEKFDTSPSNAFGVSDAQVVYFKTRQVF